MKYPIKIRLYANENSSLYALAHIWPNKKAMIEGAGCKKSFAAMAHGVELIRIFPDGKQRKRPVFSHLHFNEKKLNIYILSHECLHAAINWLERTGEDVWVNKAIGSHNENFVGVQDYMLYQLYCRIGKLKLGGWSY